MSLHGAKKGSGIGIAWNALQLILATAVSLAALSDTVTAAEKCAGRETDPDCALYVIARKCINTELPEYCTTCPFPRTSYCLKATTCEQTTEVWAGSQRYVAIRDRTMCSCPEVMHGLVMPLGAISGIEDVDRPQGIWKFAWDVANNTGIPPDQIALIVSSPDHRSQSQLHVHIIPLAPARAKDLESTPFVEVPDLRNVWVKAGALGESKAMKPFGVMVHKAGEVWHVHVDNAPLVDTYSTLPDCVRPKKKD